MSLYNISYLCNYFSSSVSEWEKYKKGGLLDGSISQNRYSVHTLDEFAPFVHISLYSPCLIRNVQIVIRDVYLERVVPLTLQVKTLEGWRNCCDFSSTCEISVDMVITDIRISKSSQGSVVLSSVNILTDYDSFLSWYDVRFCSNYEALAYAHCKFYGLGGRLSVIATALGFIGNQNYIKEVVLDVKSAQVVKFPKAINLNNHERHYKILEQGLASHFVDYIFNDGQYISKRGIALYKAEEQLANQLRKAVVITRDDLKSYVNKDEADVEACRRLYSRIIPHDRVIARLRVLEEKFNLKKYYNTALAIHIRHGNGEKYYSPSQKVWGVKPPSAKKIMNAIHKVLVNDNIITDLILSSDCKAVATFIKSQFPKKRIHYISEYVQPLGAGCNHNNIAFDQDLERQSISLELEDEIVFSEILALSQCRSLCGGHSYFFEAVKYFSNCDVDNIYYLNNSDRYIEIDESFHLLTDTKDEKIVPIRNQLKGNGIYIDGLFYKLSKDGDLSIAYFNDLILNTHIRGILLASDIELIKKNLLSLRLY